MKPKPRSARRKPSPLECTAYHEAGHFVAYMFSKKCPAVRRVSIVPNPRRGSLGHVLPFPTPTFNPELEIDLNRIADEIVCYLAGGVAEKRFAGRANHLGARSDYSTASDLALRASGSGEAASAMLRWLRFGAEGLVRVRWWAVEALAKVLLDRETMTGKEARQLVYAEMDRRAGISPAASESLNKSIDRAARRR